MASERFLAALNEQIAREFVAAHQYVAVGNYYAAETFPRLASFF
jgi:bacterioferritin B